MSGDAEMIAFCRREHRWTEAGERGDGAVWHPDSGWTRMARSPLAPRVGVASVWTGDRLLIWGGAAGDVYHLQAARETPRV